MDNLKITKRTKVNRLPKRASYDRNVIYSVLDGTFICHIAFNIKEQPYNIPTVFGRKDDSIYFHGLKNGRMFNAFETSEDVCVTVTLVDGIVLARSAFHHSLNYKSVVIFGKPEKIITNNDKLTALEIIMEHIITGRWADSRKPNEKELNATKVYSLKIKEASAKIREGGANDDPEDMSLNIWAGVLPLKMVFGEPIKDENLNNKVEKPGYLYKLKI